MISKIKSNLVCFIAAALDSEAAAFLLRCIEWRIAVEFFGGTMAGVWRQDVEAGRVYVKPALCRCT